MAPLKHSIQFAFALTLFILSSGAEAKLLISKRCHEDAVRRIVKYVPHFGKRLNEVFQNKWSYSSTWGFVKGSGGFQEVKQPYHLRLSKAEVASLYDVLSNRDIRVDCLPEGHRDCEDRGGFAQKEGTFFNRTPRVVICNEFFQAHIDEGCSLISSIFHEVAHVAEIPYSRYHNDHDLPNFHDLMYEHDKVYQFGHAVQNMCTDEIGLKPARE